MNIRLVAVDEHVLLRLGLASVLAATPDIVLVGEAASAAEAERVVEQTNPAVVTLELSLPDGDGISTAGRLRIARPDLGIVLLTASNDDALLYRALDAGLSAFVTKSAPVSTVLAAVRHAATAPHSFTAPGLQTALTRRSSHGGLLSPRERQVLLLMRDGTSLPAIATRLQVSEATVKTYVSRLYSKLRVNNRAQALMVAVNQGLLPTADVAA
ncbi:response regulator transcription factor [Planosporangium flavigriseum]|uniref:DNA-binding response regulator n=1 Tax=Planosporangium flavigriseum TaxID=373681 RepID=A0A8J3LZB3_9ACTN|nr:response regulator transcription factor [Planosporangium flavigriseum]NJC67205.1 response regulator transcription factor [Planosporangium flavigriseum]GIG76135.1 DNA-binding response regulator [Planosporangium flavigriseum]